MCHLMKSVHNRDRKGGQLTKQDKHEEQQNKNPQGIQSIC